MQRPSTRKRESGATIIEFTLSLMFLVPLLLGTLVFGFRLVWAQQIDQITRDLAHIYIREVQFGTTYFNTTPGVTEAQDLANQFNLTSTGQSVAIFSTITLETAAMCNAGTGKNTNTCTNLNQPVFTQQIAIGNTSGNGSAFGTPTSSGSLPATSGVSNNYSTSVTAADDAQSTWAVAKGFGSLITLTSGQYAYMVEMYNNAPQLSISGLTGMAQVYSRAIF
jgi:hypothetical protein